MNTANWYMYGAYLQYSCKWTMQSIQKTMAELLQTFPMSKLHLYIYIYIVGINPLTIDYQFDAID